MVTMDKEIRRKEKKMSREECMDVLSKAEYGVLSTISEDNTPYGVPMNFAVTDDALYFHCATAGHRLENIAYNDNVCFNVVDSVVLMADKFNTQYRSVTIFGKVEKVEDAGEKRKGLTALVEKLSPQYMEAGVKYINSSFDEVIVLRMDISKMTGKATRG